MVSFLLIVYFLIIGVSGIAYMFMSDFVDIFVPYFVILNTTLGNTANTDNIATLNILITAFKSIPIIIIILATWYMWVMSQKRGEYR
jgi:hypothetical protein